MDVLGDDVSMDDAFKAADNVLRNAVGGIAEIINFPAWSTSTSRTCGRSWAKWAWR
jgi:cell division GTPase FtsZ